MQDLRRKAKIEMWRGVGLDVLKWAFVVWLLSPLLLRSGKSVPVTRIVAGIALFVVFAGKLFYDTLIMEFVRQRRTTVKQDLITLIGMLAAVLLLVGFVLATLALLMGQWRENAAQSLSQ